MAARIFIKNIDYFKYKKLVIDANRDDYASCSKEVQAFCDCVQTIHFRDEEFDDDHDRGRFAEVCAYYKQILSSKRIDPIDMRIKSGWWGEHKNAYSAGKLKPSALREKLVLKTSDYNSRHGNAMTSTDEINEKLDGPGLYVFKHKEHQCFQYVGRAAKIVSRAAEKLKAAFEGSSQEPLSALLIISMCNDWDFYFLPVDKTDGEEVLRILENDLILKHDSIWPHGLNFRLHIDSLLEVSEFRKSCLRHHWPPDMDVVDDSEIDVRQIRLGLEASAFEPLCAPEPVIPKNIPASKAAAAGGAEKKKKKVPPPIQPVPEPVFDAPTPPDLSPVEGDVPDQPPSPTMSTSTFVVSECTVKTIRPSPQPSPAQVKRAIAARPTSAGRKGSRGSGVAAVGSKPARPTTPRGTRAKATVRSPKAPQSQNGSTEHSPEDAASLTFTDDLEGDLERSQSASSLSSGDSKRLSRDSGAESPSKGDAANRPPSPTLSTLSTSTFVVSSENAPKSIRPKSVQFKKASPIAKPGVVAGAAQKKRTATRKPPIREVRPQGLPEPSPELCFPDVTDRPPSPTMSTVSSSTFVVSNPIEPIPVPVPAKKVMQRPTSAGRKASGRGRGATAIGTKPARPTTPRGTRAKATARAPKSPQSQSGSSEHSPEDAASLTFTDDSEMSQSAASLSPGDKRLSQLFAVDSPPKTSPTSSDPPMMDSRLPVSNSKGVSGKA